MTALLENLSARASYPTSPTPIAQLGLEPLGIRFVNADLIARDVFPHDPEGHSYEAAKLAEAMRHRLLGERCSFCFETVFSHPSKIDFMGKAKSLGYTVHLVFIHLGDPALNLARISQRVLEGGHGVPAHKVVSRIPRTLGFVKLALFLCDHGYVLDNSSHIEPFRLLATLDKLRGATAITRKKDLILPDWASRLLELDSRGRSGAN